MWTLAAANQRAIVPEQLKVNIFSCSNITFSIAGTCELWICLPKFREPFCLVAEYELRIFKPEDEETAIDGVDVVTELSNGKTLLFDVL